MSTTLFERPEGLTDVRMHYCPGCGHGIVHRIIAECISEMGETDNTIICAPVGCAVFIPRYFTYDSIHCAHGRAPATATGIKRVHPDKMVITYQGDGDLASIGMAEIVHAAARGEKITTIFINNGIYGMTGGQMAPTTLDGQVTTSSPSGRNPELTGHPIDVTKLMTGLPIAYLARGSVASPRDIRETKKMVKKALQKQIEKKGFSMVEILSPCPTNWGLTPLQSWERIQTDVKKVYPTGEYIEDGKGVQ